MTIFSPIAASYARYRPRYPDELFAWLARAAPGRTRACDLATGNGQAALGLAARFAEVVAVDASARQIAHAATHARLRYRIARSHDTGLEDRSADLVAIAQAAHWLDLDDTWREVRRILAPGGVIAVWGYGAARFLAEPLADAMRAGIEDTLAPWWAPGNRLLWHDYRDLPFPFREVAGPSLRLRVSWTLDELVGYVRTWSATQRYVEATGEDPTVRLREVLGEVWGDPAARHEVAWNLATRIGRAG